MSFLHIHLVCRGMTYPDQIHVEESHIQTRWVWKNDRSRSDGCGGMTYQDQVGVEDGHIRTRWMWRNDISQICHSSTFTWSGYVIHSHISGPDMSFLHIHTSHPDMSFLHIHLVRNQVGVEE
jgi:hypothetical protein